MDDLKNTIYIVNFVCIGVHAAQMIAIAVILGLSSQLVAPVCINTWDRTEGFDQEITCEILFNSYSGWYLFTFIFISLVQHIWMAIRMHLCVESIWTGNFWYMLDQFQNPYRWIEYQFSASFMLLAIAQLSGVVSLPAQLALFFLTLTINTYGHLMERTNSHIMLRNEANQSNEYASMKTYSTTSPLSLSWVSVDWLPYWYGWIPGVTIWISILPMYIYFISDIPWWVIGAFFGLFGLFSSFAFVMPYVYKQPSITSIQDGITSKVRYYRGELFYQILSLTSKTFLVWFVIGGFLGSDDVKYKS